MMVFRPISDRAQSVHFKFNFLHRLIYLVPRFYEMTLFSEARLPIHPSEYILASVQLIFLKFLGEVATL